MLNFKQTPPNNRVFIGAPVYDKVDHTVLEDWMRFAYHLGRRMPEYDFYLGIKPKSEQFRARNDIVTGALTTNCDWLLMMDDDMVINTFVTSGVCEDYDFLKKLIAHDKDVCGIRYYQRGGSFDPVLMYKAGEAGYRFLREEELTNGLQKVDVVGGGCMLIKTKVFDKIGYPYFAPEFKYGTDIQLCKKAAEHGFEVWADTSIEIGHLKSDKIIVTSRNRKNLVLQNSVPGDVQRELVTADIWNRLEADVAEYLEKSIDETKMFGQFSGNQFMAQHAFSIPDPEWYRMYPKERVARQLWFNTTDAGKKYQTEYVINTISTSKTVKVLDFGCGIGIPAFTLAENGHNVTAMDIRGTGTLEFLKWRAAKYGVNIRFWESEGGAPALGDEEFDVIIAMDSIEHIKEWKIVIRQLAKHLKTNGILFANNGIFEDNMHPEHYRVESKEFISTCMEAGMMPFNQVTYVKKQEVPVYA